MAHLQHFATALMRTRFPPPPQSCMPPRTVNWSPTLQSGRAPSWEAGVVWMAWGENLPGKPTRGNHGLGGNMMNFGAKDVEIPEKSPMDDGGVFHMTGGVGYPN